MPTYDYKCSQCGHLFEELQSMNAAPLVDCPSCGKPALKRLIAGGAGMVFKGSGFYLTDYGKAGSAKSPSPSGGNPADTSEKSGKAESSEKTGKAEKSGKSEKSEKQDSSPKPSASSSGSDATGSK